MKRVLAVLLPMLLLPLAPAELMPVPCSDWYTYGSVDFPGLITDRLDYSPGEEIRITSEVHNLNPIPLVGDVRAKVVRYTDDGNDYVLDEFFMAEDVALAPNGTQGLRGSWEIPAGLESGDYKIALFFITADSFNMGGVSFLNRVYGGITTFQISGGSELLYLGTGEMSINGEPHPLNEPIGSAFEQGEAITVEMPVRNVGSPTQAELSYELYEWDDLKEGDLLESSQETVQLDADGSADLAYTTPADLPAGAYLLKIIARGKNDATAKVRLPVGGKSIKLNFAGIESFPVEEGEPVKLFLCASNVAENTIEFSIDEEAPLQGASIQDATLRVALEADGQTVFQDSVSGAAVTAAFVGYETTFTPDRDYQDLTLKVTAGEGSGSSDEAVIAYDFESFIDEMSVDVGTQVVDDKVTVTVRLAPVKGEVELYLVDQSGQAVVDSTLTVDGEVSGTYILPNGAYEVVAVEPSTGARATEEFTVSYTPPPPPKEKEADYTLPILILLVVIIVLGMLLVKKDELKKWLGKRSSGPEGKKGRPKPAGKAPKKEASE